MKKNDILLAVNYYSDMYYFVQVIKATDKTVTVRRIYANQRTGLPCVGQFNEMDGPMTKRVSNGKIRLGDWTSAELWNGEPLNNMHPMFGKNYNLF